jgi:hypothetical protein
MQPIVLMTTPRNKAIRRRDLLKSSRHQGVFRAYSAAQWIGLRLPPFSQLAIEDAEQQAQARRIRDDDDYVALQEPVDNPARDAERENQKHLEREIAG